MKQAYFLMGLLVAVAPATHAVDFNKEALKSMQQEGHKIVEESADARMYRAGGGFCLGSAGQKLVIKACNNGDQSQKWRMNDSQQLVAHDGRCVGIAAGDAVLQKCGGAKNQKWSQDGKKRLVNNARQCLQFLGDTAAGSSVASANCNKTSRQVWN